MKNIFFVPSGVPESIKKLSLSRFAIDVLRSKRLRAQIALFVKLKKLGDISLHFFLSLHFIFPQKEEKSTKLLLTKDYLLTTPQEKHLIND